MKEICPNCKSERYERMYVTGSDGYTYLIINEVGSVNLNVCRDCGVVYLAGKNFEKINKTRPEEIVGSQEYYYHKYNIKKTKEKKWDSDFSNITRTITLKLPTWGEFHKKTYYGEHYGVIFQGQETGCFYQMCEHLNPNSITIYNMDSHDIIFSMPQTEENYILACKKCRELFLGKGE